MSVSRKQWGSRTLSAASSLLLVLMLSACAAPLPVDRSPLPEAMLETELPSARSFSVKVSTFFQSVERDTSDAPDDTTQTTFTINFDLRVGDVLNAWTVPYDRGQASETKARLDALQAQVVELSQKVVYKNEQAAS